MRILIADDHPMVRDALAQALAGFAEDLTFVEATDHDSLLAMADDSALDIALVDLNMPGMNGMSGVRRLHARHPTLPLIVVSGQSDPGTARAALEAGAGGFVPKTEPAETLMVALRAVLSGRVHMPSHAVLALHVDAHETPAAPISNGTTPSLTARQLDVLALLQKGASNKMIARHLGLTEGTVKLHVAALLRALRARNRTEAVVHARALGLGES